MSKMTVRQRLIFLTIFLVLTTILVTSIGIIAISSSSKSGRNLFIISTAELNHMNGDMMHDALRADVLNALLLRTSLDLNKKEDILSDLQKHSQRFRDSLNANRSLPLDPDVRKLLDEISPALESYIFIAEQTTNKIFNDPSSSQKSLIEFQKAFEYLEDRQEEVSKQIKKIKELLVDEDEKTGSHAILIMSVVGLLSLIIGGWCATYISISITRPLSRAAKAINQIRAGNRSITFDYKIDDELGEVCSAILEMQKQAEELEQADITQKNHHQAEINRSNGLRVASVSFRDSIKNIIQSLGTAGESLVSIANSMFDVAKRISQRISNISDSAEQALNAIQTVAAATEQLSISVTEVGRKTHETSSGTTEAVIQADAAAKKIKELAFIVGKVDDVVKLISSIAGQTNLLALNATIEAARAGEAGKGFAVVATEVKALARQTADATDTIGKQISDIQRETSSSVEAIKIVVDTIGRIQDCTSAITDAVKQQNTTTVNIVQNMNESAQSTYHITKTLRELVQETQKAEKNAASVIDAAGDVSGQVKNIHRSVSGFITTTMNL
ncbi:methyl-accepting chemotaxis protein [Azospirillaceae bacterium]